MIWGYHYFWKHPYMFNQWLSTSRSHGYPPLKTPSLEVLQCSVLRFHRSFFRPFFGATKTQATHITHRIRLWYIIYLGRNVYMQKKKYIHIYINTVPMDPSWGSKSWKQIHANWTLERDIGAYWGANRQQRRLFWSQPCWKVENSIGFSLV